MTKSIYLSPPHMDALEREMLLEAFDSNWVTSVGPHIDAFEGDVAAALGVRRVVAVASGTAALHLALQVLGVGPGDEVLVPSFTFAASANPVAYLGATPVFIDCSPDTWTIDVALLEGELERRAAIGKQFKAVVPVDLFGQCCDYDALLKVCEAYGVLVVEDSAEALGSTYRDRQAGSFGDAAILSFNGNKILTTGGGGMVVTDDDDLADQARYLATQAREPLPYYEHRAIGYNYRMNNVLAAIGRAQLAHLPQRVAARRALFANYSEQFSDVAGITMMPQADYGVSNCWLTCITIDADEFGASPEQVRLHLASLGIESRATWKPMHMQPVFADAPMIGGAVCADLYARGLCLPSGSALSETEQSRVIAEILAVPARKDALR